MNSPQLHNNDEPSTVENADDVIAEEYAAHEPAPVRAGPVYWLFAPLAAVAALFVPRRMGPHAAASGWRAACVVHVLSVLMMVALWIILVMLIDPPFIFTESLPPPGELIRIPAAWMVVLALIGTENVINAVVATVYILFIEGTVWVFAMMLMPWMAAGESSPRLYLRCAKLLLWSTVTLLLMPLTACLLVGLHGDGDDVLPLIGVVMSAVGVYALRVLLRMGNRYGGPASGPGFETRTMNCEGCGYNLALQRRDGRCPECGRPVVFSLPERRCLPRFAAARGLWQRARAFLPTLRASLSAAAFGRRLAVHSGRIEARRFAIWVCVMLGAISAVLNSAWTWLGIRASRRAWSNDVYFEHYYFVVPPVIMDLVVTPLLWGLTSGLCMFAVIVLAAWLTSLFGWVQPARRGLVVCYASGWLIIPYLLGVLASLGVWLVVSVWDPNSTIRVPLVGLVDVAVIVTMFIVAVPVCGLLLWFGHIWRMLRETRHANA